MIEIARGNNHSESQLVGWERWVAIELRGLLSVARITKQHKKSNQAEAGCDSETSWKKLCTGGDEILPLYSQKFTQEEYLQLDSMRDRCRPAASTICPLGDQYELVCRVLERRHGTLTRTQKSLIDPKNPSKPTKRSKKNRCDVISPTLKRRKTDNTNEPVVLVRDTSTETIQDLVVSCRQRLNDQIDARLKWKSSQKCMKGILTSGTVNVDCSDREVFLVLFDIQEPTNQDGDNSDSTIRRVFQSDEDFKDLNLCDKSCRNGVRASLKVPAEAIWCKGRIVFSFHFLNQTRK